MKCPICKKEIDELEDICPYCKTNFDEYEKDTHSKETKHKGLGCGIVLLILVAIIFVPMIFNSLSNLNKTKQEGKLIQEGKIIPASEIINEIVDILKNKDENKLEMYLSDNFKYYDNNNYESKFASGFLSDLKILSSSYEVERRGDTGQSEVATYRIYWNVVENNKINGFDKTSQYYCLQEITIMLKKVTKEHVITYEIDKIILTDN